MRKLAFSMLCLMLVGAALPVLAGDAEVTAELWTRAEYADDFDLDSTIDDEVDFAAYLARIGLGFEINDNIDAMFEVQSFGHWGDSGTFSAAGLGAGLSQPLGQLTDSLVLYQANVTVNNLGRGNLSLKIGRQEHVLGNELHFGDNDFYNGSFFDGIRASWDFDAWDLDAFIYILDENDLSTSPGVSDDYVAGSSANFTLGSEKHSIEAYFFYKSDNGVASAYSAFTLGALYEYSSDNGGWDWSFEGALQDGTIDVEMTAATCPVGTACDLQAFIVEGDLGYGWGGNHHVTLGGLLVGEGDDAVDSDTFMFLRPDVHRRAGTMDIVGGAVAPGLANVTDIYASYGYFGDTNSFELTYHEFLTTEDTVAPFGLDFGGEVDLVWNRAINPDHAGLQIGAGVFMPDAAAADDAMRVWAMFSVRK